MRDPGGSVLIVELENRSSDGVFVDELRRFTGVESAELHGHVLRIGVRDLTLDTGKILEWLANASIRAVIAFNT